MERIGVVAALWRYPVKGLAAEPLMRAEVEAAGFAGDRHHALVVQTAGHAREGKPYRGKEDNRLHLYTDSADAVEIAAQRGVEIADRDGGPYFDLAPVSVIFDTWIQEAEAMCGTLLDALRFRPNILVQADPHAVALRETDVVGRTFAAGDVILRATQPIERCVTISYEVATGTPQPEVQRTIVQQRANIMGVYCNVVRAGVLHRGDVLQT